MLEEPWQQAEEPRLVPRPARHAPHPASHVRSVAHPVASAGCRAPAHHLARAVGRLMVGAEECAAMLLGGQIAREAALCTHMPALEAGKVADALGEVRHQAAWAPRREHLERGQHRARSERERRGRRRGRR